MKEKQINDEFEAWWNCPLDKHVNAPVDCAGDDIYLAFMGHGDELMRRKVIFEIVKRYAQLAFEGGVAVAVRDYEEDGLA